MRNRDYKIFSKDRYYHIFNRGNNKQDIFFEPADYEFFLYRLKENLFGLSKHVNRGEYKRKVLPPGSFVLIAYCLMPNHFHMLIKQNASIPVSKLISKLCTSYSMYVNKKYERVGGLFQDQFKSINIDSDKYALWLSAYIHNNPKLAGLVQDLTEYTWSSHLDYIGRRKGELCDQKLIMDFFKGNRKEYENFVIASTEEIKIRKDLQRMILEE